jgi:hypothetical protein
MSANGDDVRPQGELMGPYPPPDTPLAFVVVAVMVHADEEDYGDDWATCERCGGKIAVVASARQSIATLPGPPATVMLCGDCALASARAWSATVDIKPWVREWDIPEITGGKPTAFCVEHVEPDAPEWSLGPRRGRVTTIDQGEIGCSFAGMAADLLPIFSSAPPPSPPPGGPTGPPPSPPAAEPTGTSA